MYNEAYPPPGHTGGGKGWGVKEQLFAARATLHSTQQVESFFCPFPAGAKRGCEPSTPRAPTRSRLKPADPPTTCCAREIRPVCSVGDCSFSPKVKDTVRASLEETGASKVLLVAHSAGGWLARAALAEGEWEEGVASQDVVAGERVSVAVYLTRLLESVNTFLLRTSVSGTHPACDLVQFQGGQGGGLLLYSAIPLFPLPFPLR